MDDYRDLEQDYIRRLKEAQERGDTTHVPLIDEKRVCHVHRFMPVQAVRLDALKTMRKFLTREGLGGVRP